MEITIQNALTCDYEKIADLCDRRYGKGYMTAKNFNKMLKNPDFIKVATINGEFVGFASFLHDTTENIAKAMGLCEDEVTKISNGLKCVIYKSAAIEAKFEHYGIMQKLLSNLIQQAEKENYSAVFASAWIIGNTIPIEKNLKKFSFEYIANRSMLWYDDEDYSCIVCNGRCRCDAAIYYKKL